MNFVTLIFLFPISFCVFYFWICFEFLHYSCHHLSGDSNRKFNVDMVLASLVLVLIKALFFKHLIFLIANINVQTGL